jgi:hypothetical protein
MQAYLIFDFTILSLEIRKHYPIREDIIRHHFWMVLNNTLGFVTFRVTSTGTCNLFKQRVVVSLPGLILEILALIFITETTLTVESHLGPSYIST